MSKYIDTEKLIVEIERQRDSALERQKNLEKMGQETVLNEMIVFKLNKILSFIDSLQQEQESVAERFARIIRGNLIGIDKEVQQKFEKLYFEVTGNKIYGGYHD